MYKGGYMLPYKLKKGDTIGVTAPSGPIIGNKVFELLRAKQIVEKVLREEMQKLCAEKNVDLSIPPMKYCTDNATMIACAAYPQFLKHDFSDFSLHAKSQEYFFKNEDM